MFNSNKPDNRVKTASGRELPLVFVYDNKAYYHDIAEFHDELSTAVVDLATDEAAEGLSAAQALASAVAAYVDGGEAPDLWMSAEFKPAVAWMRSERGR